MLYLFLIIIGIFFLIEYTLQKSYITPLSLLLLSFFMALTIISINKRDWDVHLSHIFFEYIIIAIASFTLGVVFIRFVVNRSTLYINAPLTNEKHLVFSGYYPEHLMLFVSVLCSLAYLLLMFVKIDTSNGLLTGFRSSYDYYSTGGTAGFFVNQLLEIVIAIGKITLFELFVTIYYKKDSIKWTFLLPQFLALSCLTISTDRNIFIRYISFALILWILFYSFFSENKSATTNIRIFRKASLYLIVLFFVFFGLGKLKAYTSDINRVIGIYGGSGLYNFNLFLESFSGKNLLYGKSTFSELIKTLNTLGLIKSEPISSSIHGEFITYLSSTGYVYASNIYSAMRPYVEDFGIWGVFIYPFVLGLLFEYVYYYTKKNTMSFSWVFYSLMAYPLIYFSIAEQFFRRFHLGMFYEIFWVLLFYSLIYGPKGLWRKRIVVHF